MPAFAKAHRLGADFVEFDVRPSREGHYYLLHDSRLDRTTTGKGSIREASDETIAKLDAGSWFANRFAGTHVPTLDAFLDAVPKGQGLYFDAKDIPPSALAAALKSHGLVEQAIVYQGAGYLAELQQVDADIRRMPPASSIEQVTRLAEKVKPFAVDTPWRALSQAYIDHCHAAGIQVFSDAPGSANLDSYRQAMAWGIDLIQTDFPLRYWRALELELAHRPGGAFDDHAAVDHRRHRFRRLEPEHARRAGPSRCSARRERRRPTAVRWRSKSPTRPACWPPSSASSRRSWSTWPRCRTSTAASANRTWPERINVDGATNVARACSRAGARLIFTSTDAVFDGTKGHLPGGRPADAGQLVWPDQGRGRTRRRVVRCPPARSCRSSLVLGTSAATGGNSYLEKVLASLRAGKPIISPTFEFRNPIDVGTLCAVARRVGRAAGGLRHLSRRRQRQDFALRAGPCDRRAIRL